MSTAVMQICLLLGVFVPLASFVFLVFFGTRLPGTPPAGGHGHDDHGHGHDDHGHDGGGGHAHADHAHAGAGHDSHGHAAHDQSAAAHAHEDHGFPPKVRRTPKGNPTAGWVATAAIGFSLLMAVLVFFTWSAHSGMGEEAVAWRQQTAAAAAANSVNWANLGPVPIEFGVRLDSLTVIMFLMVSLCSTCIHVFSIGYMKNDPRYPRFFTYLSLFCFSMLGLLISQNILFLFIFWELVGLCSYLLIGFWFEKKSASDAAIKAFVTNRVGDFGFLIGLMLCYTYLGTLSLDAASATFEAGAHNVGLLPGGHPSAAAAAVPAAAASRASGLFTSEFFGVTLATWLGIGLFCGAIGKSAQFPLQVWLPDAMEGPTPVSALIHAATMVAAGVYLVGRVFTLLTPEAQSAIAIIGCITLTMAALIAVVQTDIKRVLAYSTLSQLGYMIFALGIGAWIAALFHLLTHAFFKAMLFLGSGQVIEGCHHEQQMTKMGGLWRKMPGTATTFLIAVLAISGAGIPGTIFGIGGFYSKDEILEVGYYRHHVWNDQAEPPAPADAGRSHGGEDADGSPRVVLASYTQEHAADHAQDADVQKTGQRPVPHGSQQAAGHEPVEPGSAEHGPGEHGSGTDYAAAYPEVQRLPRWLYLLPMLVAYVTPFYMGRCFILTFLGKPRDPHIHDHAHESRIMVLPLFVLAAMTLISGPLIFRNFVAYSAPVHAALVPMIDGHDHAIHALKGKLALLVGFSFVVGLGLAWLVYRNGLGLAESIKKLPVMGSLHNILWNKFYFDHVYNAVLVMGTRGFAVLCGVFDNWIIDGLVNLAGRFTAALSWFTGIVLDNKGVDGAVNGTGQLAWGLGGVLRSTHTGVIRNYILMAVIVVAGVIVSRWSVAAAVVLVVLAACTVAAPRVCVHVVAPLAVAAALARVGRIVLSGFFATGDAGAWNWNELTNFWPVYFTTAAGLGELALLLLLWAGLYVRYRGLEAEEGGAGFQPAT